MLTRGEAQPERLGSITFKDEPERRKQFIERMERKLAYKTAMQRRHRQQFRTRLVRLQS